MDTEASKEDDEMTDGDAITPNGTDTVDKPKIEPEEEVKSAPVNGKLGYFRFSDLPSSSSHYTKGPRL